MKRNIILIFFATFVFVMPTTLMAQSFAGRTAQTTVYEDFQPAVILTTNGKTITEKRANIFLKNSSLVFKRNKSSTLEANTKQIQRVDFPDRTYLRVDTLLAFIVDSVESNKLLCATTIDVATYRSQLLNNVQITNIEAGTNFTVTTNDNSSDEEKLYPLQNTFYFLVDGKIINAHERAIQRALPKEKHRAFKTILQSPNFTWGNSEFLMQILKLLSS